MNTSFQAVCEAAQAAWTVPALAVGTLVDGTVTAVHLGCDPGTRFRIASITKPIVATLAVDLLDLDEPTGVWPDDVRVRHLLSHTSGFECELADRDYGRFGRGDDALARCVAELPSVRRLRGSGEIWSYANTGFWLVGLLAAERAGGTFEDVLADRVLLPARMEWTTFDEPDLEGNGAELPPPPFPRARRPSGGLTSTVDDLLRFGRTHLADPGAARMRVVAGRPVAGVYGLGLFGERVAGEEVWGHPGSYGGFESSLLTVPSRGAVFAGLTNSERGGKALRRIEDAWLEQAVGAPRRVPPTVDVSPEELAEVTGRYATQDGAVDVTLAGRALLLSLPDGSEVAARPIGPRTFELDGDHVGERLDFPLPGFIRIGSRLAERPA
jgi:D-alanyl-D-alanine carboxypeptidase